MQIEEEMRVSDDEGDGEKGDELEEVEDDRPKNSNPLNIPLGYDGKPIPYWLYKLHGL